MAYKVTDELHDAKLSPDVFIAQETSADYAGDGSDIRYRIIYGITIPRTSKDWEMNNPISWETMYGKVQSSVFFWLPDFYKKITNFWKFGSNDGGETGYGSINGIAFYDVLETDCNALDENMKKYRVRLYNFAEVFINSRETVDSVETGTMPFGNYGYYSSNFTLENLHTEIGIGNETIYYNPENISIGGIVSGIPSTGEPFIQFNPAKLAPGGVCFVYDEETLECLTATDYEVNTIPTVSSSPTWYILAVTGGTHINIPTQTIKSDFDSAIIGKTFTEKLTDGTEHTFTITSVNDYYKSGLSFIEDTNEQEEASDMFTNMVGLWELAASEQQNLATALEYSQEQNDPILNSIVGMRIFKTPSVDWAKNSAASRIFTREHSGSYTYVNGQKLTNQFNTYSIGTYTFSPHFNNFLDYPPYTKIFLFLPFVGLINLDANIVMGKTVYINVSIDAYSGDITYEVRQGADTGGGLPLSTYTSNCSIELPIPSQVNQDYKIGLAIASLAINTMGSVVGEGGKANPLAGITTAAGGAVNIAGTIMSGGYDDIKTERGNLSGGHGWNNYSTPFVMIVRPIDGADSSYSAAKGLPTMKTKTLSACSGFTACIEPKVECNGTEEEKQTIKNLLESGVII